MKALKIAAIVGCRNYKRRELMDGHIRALKQIHGTKKIVTGDASGADESARILAKTHQLELLVFQANWEMQGKKAGPIRNQNIIDHADVLLAYWDGKSKGTKDSIDKAIKKGIDVHIYHVKKEL